MIGVIRWAVAALGRTANAGGSSRRLAGIACALLGLLALLVAGASSMQDGAAERLRAMRPVEAADLFAEYAANELGADARYRGRPLKVAGRVSGVGRDLLGEPYLTLRGGGLLGGVRCLLTRDGATEAARLSSGDEATVIGVVRGKFWDVTLERCEVER